MRILLTNDDGIHAVGLCALRERIRDLGEVITVAPATEQSGVSHSITYQHAIRAQRTGSDDDPGWTVWGTPADCVKLAILELLPWKPDLVVSGINLGLNIGVAALYSGTVAAAVEGSMFGIPSIAASMEVFEPEDVTEAAKAVRRVVETVVGEDAPTDVILNLNVPAASRRPRRELRITRLRMDSFSERFESYSEDGCRHYWLAGEINHGEIDPETDVGAVLAGHVSLTPLRLDITAEDRRAVLERMNWALPKDEA